jgi:hypothetical protein
MYSNLEKSMVQNSSKCSWTCMKTTMIISWLLGGLILQQTSNLWFFTSRANNTNCIRIGLLGCSLKLHMMIGQQLLKLSRCNVHMLPYFLLRNWNDGSNAKNWWMQHASSILSIGSILLLRNVFEDI